MSEQGPIVVVGSGHNALIAANYLASAGRQVVVFEADDVPGGAVSTVERFPGHRVDRGSAAHIMIRHTGILEELDLAAYGLRYLEVDPWAYAPTPPGTAEPPIVFRRDLDATVDSIGAALGRGEAQAYRRFVADWGPRSARVMQAFGREPTARGLGAAFWPDGRKLAPIPLSHRYLRTCDATLDEYFDSERLKAALAWFGAQSGPPMSEPGTASMVGFAALMHTLPPGRAVGGSGALTDALLARLRALGGEVHTGEPVRALRRDGKRWRVDTTRRSVQAAQVLSGAHILRTFDLLEAGGFDHAPISRWRKAIRVGPGLGFVVRAATSALPAYPGVTDTPDLDAHTGIQLLASDRRALAAAQGAAAGGRLPEHPVVLAMTFSALDPSIAPPGQHQVTMWAQWHPYRLADGRSWDVLAEPEADRAFAEWDRWAPGFSASVLDRYIQTPTRIESELNMVGGNVMHVEMSLDQMLLFRPHPELARYRVPGAKGLWLTGASTHPGGGVIGAGGRTVARLMLR